MLQLLKTRNLIIIGIAILVLGGGVTYAAVRSNTPAEESVASKQQAPTETIEDTPNIPINDAAVPQVTSPQPSTSTPAAPTAEENKTHITQVITDYIQSKGGSDNAVQHDMLCFDTRIFANPNNENMYSNYDSMINHPTVQKYLAGTFTWNGQGSCGVTTSPSQSD